MPGKKKKLNKNFVTVDGFDYPRYLFHFRESTRGILPNARINPAAAVKGQSAWENSTSPSKIPEKKAIILDSNSLKKPYDVAQETAFIKTLLDQGFKVLIKLGNAVYTVLPSNEGASKKELKRGIAFKYLHSLIFRSVSSDDNLEEQSYWNASFEDKDYTQIVTQFGIARDKTVFLKADQLEEVKKTFRDENGQNLWQYFHGEVRYDTSKGGNIKENYFYYFSRAVKLNDDRVIFYLRLTSTLFNPADIDRLIKNFPRYTDSFIRLAVELVRDQKSLYYLINKIPDHFDKIIDECKKQGKDNDPNIKCTNLLPIGRVAQKKDLPIPGPLQKFGNPSQLEMDEICLNSLLFETRSYLEWIQHSKDTFIKDILKRLIVNYTSRSDNNSILEHIFPYVIVICNNSDEVIQFFREASASPSLISSVRSFFANLPFNRNSIIQPSNIQCFLAVTNNPQQREEIIDACDFNQTTSEQLLRCIQFAKEHEEKLIKKFFRSHIFARTKAIIEEEGDLIKYLLADKSPEFLKEFVDIIAATGFSSSNLEQLFLAINDDNYFEDAYEYIINKFSEKITKQDPYSVISVVSAILRSLDKKYITPKTLDSLANLEIRKADGAPEIAHLFEINYLIARKKNPNNSEIENIRIAVSKGSNNNIEQGLNNLRKLGIISHQTYRNINREQSIELELLSNKRLPRFISQPRPHPKVSQTYLHISDFSDIDELIKDQDLSSIVTLEINCFYIEFDRNIEKIRRLKEYLPNIQQIIYTTKQPNGLPQIGLNDYVKTELRKVFPLPNQIEVRDLTWIYSDRAKNDGVPIVYQQPRSQQTSANEIYINESASDERVDDANPQNVKFKMVKAGEILNPKPNQAELYVRTAVLNKDHKEVVATRFRNVNPDFIDAGEIARMRQDDSDFTHHQFSRELTVGKKHRLSSISANGERIALLGVHPRDITITRGDDDFFYAEVKKQITIEYVISCRSVEKDYKKISDPVVKRIIEKYLRNSEKKLSEIPVLRDYRNRDEWLEALYKSGNGSCAARCDAVYHVLESQNINPNTFRVTQINRNHVVIEVYDHGLKGWIQVDLGGVEAEMVYEKESQPAAASAPIISTQQKNEEAEKIAREKVEAERRALIEEQERAREAQRQVEENLRRLEQAKARLRQQATAATRTQALQSASAIPPVRTESQEDVRRREKQLAEHQKTLEQEAERLRIEQVALRKKQARQELLTKLTSFESKTVALDALEISKSKTFVITEQIEQVTNRLIEKAVGQRRDVFYLEDFAQTNFSSQTLEIISEKDAKIVSKNDLVNFLRRCQALQNIDPALRPMLFVNLDNLSDAKRAALNTMFDKDGSRTINGLKIPDCVQIVSLVSKKPNDLSLTSRHQECFEILPIEKQKAAPINPKVIDIEGLENVEEVLFGKFSLVENEIKWKKGKFLHHLESGLKEFKFINLSSEAHIKLEHLFGQAKARGYIDYYGRRVNFPKDIKIEFEEEKFDFKQFTKDRVAIGKNFLLSQTPAEARIINTYLFDILLHQKTVHDGKYVESDGLIKSHRGKTLPLFITSNLTQAQFYCMLNEAKKYDCKLELYLAKDVQLPRGLDDYHEINDRGESKNVIKPQIFISNDTKKTTQNILHQQPARDPVIIDLEDYNYQDLISEITFTKTADGFKDFRQITSDVLKAIKAGYKVILRGQFSQDMLKMLEPVIASEPPEFSNVGNNLILIIEDKNISKAQQVYQELGWLDAKSYKICDEPKTQAQANARIEREQPDPTPLDQYSAQKSQLFIDKRKQIFAKLLRENSLLSLIGPSGVGKSSFMRLIEEHRNFIKIHHDLSSFEAWAKDDREGFITLFIDESNIEDMHFTMFEQLKRGGNREVLYKGKLYQLTDRHRVVFARNPKEYGGGRVDQKLFNLEDGGCAEMHFADFPAAYLYEELLKKAIYDKLDPAIKTQIDERAFREACQKFITQYQDTNKKYKDEPNEQETARELQDKVLQYIPDLLPKKNYAIKSKDFVSIQASQAVEDALNSAITIKKQQILGKIPSNGIGINGVLFEGHSAIGKSESIAAVLKNRGIKNANELDDPAQEYCYYKIEASLSIDEKIDLLIEAFEGGNIAWLDEMDSCSENDGFEKVLNSLLTGFNPKTGKALKNEGGMLISSINSASVEGRAIIGPALRHRMRTVRATSLSEYKIQDFEKILSTWIEFENNDPNQYDLNELAKLFVDYFKAEPHPKLNLRIIRNHLDEFLELYLKVQTLSKEPRLEDKFCELSISPNVDIQIDERNGIFIWLNDIDANKKYGILQNLRGDFIKVVCENMEGAKPKQVNADDREFIQHLSELDRKPKTKEPDANVASSNTVHPSGRTSPRGTSQLQDPLSISQNSSIPS